MRGVGEMSTLEHITVKRGVDAVTLTVDEAFAAILLGSVSADGKVSDSHRRPFRQSSGK